eukprot:2138816-Prymnesium_polylepis.1
MVAGRVFTSALWGAASDRIGSRRAIIASMVSLTLAISSSASRLHFGRRSRAALHSLARST